MNSYDVKQRRALGTAYETVRCPASLTDAEAHMMQQLALQAYDALGFADFGRLDTILTGVGPFSLEGNVFASSSFSQQGKPISGMSFMAYAEGLRGQDLPDEIVQAVVRRLGMAGRDG